MRRGGRLVGPPTPMRALRTRRLLRQLARTTRESSRCVDRPPDRPEFRARRGLVLGLRRPAVRRGSPPTGSAAPSAGADGPGPSRASARGLDDQGSLTDVSLDLTRRTHGGATRVCADVPQSLTLAQQVPALIELDFEFPE